MQEVWQMMDATIVPILTYYCEGEARNDEEKK